MSIKFYNIIKLIQNNKIAITIYFIFITYFSIKIIGSFSGVIFGYADTAHWNYNAYYFSKYLSFNYAFANINLFNNESFYPYGTIQAFQSWGLEKDLLNFLSYKIFGDSAFLKYYAIFSISVSYFGFYFLLSKDFPKIHSIVPALSASFLSYYSIIKYSYHYGFLIHHWTGLSLCMDFLLTKKLFQDKNISVNLLCIRLGLLLASFGEDLTYVTSIGILSFLIHLIILVLFYLYKRRSIFVSWKINIWVILFLGIMVIQFSIFYFPIFYKIISSISLFPKDGFISAFWWSNPIRILIPIVPKFNILKPEYHVLIKDTSDGIAPYTLSSIVLVGFIYSIIKPNRKLISTLPLFLMVLILLSFHPIVFPFLIKLPWFTYFRVTARSSFAISIVFGLFSLFPNWNLLFKNRFTKILSITLFLMFIWEVKIAYSQKQNTEIKLSNNNIEYFNVIKNSIGEAILDWPFCIFGADGDDRLCPYFTKTGNQYALRQFHRKKSISQYFGRMHSSQKDIFLKAGWDKLFLKNKESNPFFAMQSRCWDESEWKFFRNFYYNNKFAGINLYADIIPNECKDEFIKYFGQPQSKTILKYSGELWYFPKTTK